jgi:hypothetical protein
MEASGIYWKPVWHILEGEFELIEKCGAPSPTT